jgi:hypothetical protein
MLAQDFSYYELPPHLLAERLGDHELLGRLAEVQFTAERELEAPAQVGELRIERIHPLRQYVLRPLSMRFRYDDEKSILIVRYRTNRFTEQRVAELVQEYLALLTEMAAYPDQRVFP